MFANCFRLLQQQSLPPELKLEGGVVDFYEKVSLEILGQAPYKSQLDQSVYDLMAQFSDFLDLWRRGYSEGVFIEID